MNAEQKAKRIGTAMVDFLSGAGGLDRAIRETGLAGDTTAIYAAYDALRAKITEQLERETS